MAKNAVAQPSANLPATADDIDSFDGLTTGLENLNQNDLLIPRLSIIQGLSPQMTRTKAEYDPNAKPGDIYDVALGERFGEGIDFIFVHYQKQWLQWAPRTSGKGLQAIHSTAEILEKTKPDERNRPILPNGDYISETAQLYGLNVSGGFRKSFIAMAVTQLKKARQMLTLATTEKLTRKDGTEFTPPIYYRSYHLSAVPESNNEGDWMGWKMERSKAMTDFTNWKDLLENVKNFQAALIAGEAKADLSSLNDEAGGGGRQSRQRQDDSDGRM